MADNVQRGGSVPSAGATQHGRRPSYNLRQVDSIRRFQGGQGGALLRICQLAVEGGKTEERHEDGQRQWEPARPHLHALARTLTVVIDTAQKALKILRHGTQIANGGLAEARAEHS